METLGAQVRTVNSATNGSVTSSPAFIDASSNTTVNGSSNVGKGLIFPRVDLSAMTAFPAVTAGIPNSFPTRFDGMIVYNTAASGTAGVGATQGTLSAGYWYYENKSSSNTGGTWKPVSTAATGVANTASNGLTLAANDVKLGGTLSQATDIVTAGNNLSISGAGKMMVGTSTIPAGGNNAKVIIDNGTTPGALQIKDGTQQLGYVLSSDANGVASWSSTTTASFANSWTSYTGTLGNPFGGSTGASGLPTGLSISIPAKGWYFFRTGMTIASVCNDYWFYINGIGEVWRTYCGSNNPSGETMVPRDQTRVLYFSSPGTYTILAGKTNGNVPSFYNAGNPVFYLDFVKFQN